MPAPCPSIRIHSRVCARLGLTLLTLALAPMGAYAAHLPGGAPPTGEAPDAYAFRPVPLPLPPVPRSTPELDMVTEAIGLARRDAETAVRGKRGRLALQRADQVLALEARKKTENAEADRKLAELRAQEDERLAEAEKAAKEQSEKDRLERHKANEWARNQAPASPAPAPVIAPEAGLLEPKATGLAVTAIRWHKNARKTWKKLDPALKPLIRTAISKVKEDGLDLGNTLTKPVKDTNRRPRSNPARRWRAVPDRPRPAVPGRTACLLRPPAARRFPPGPAAPGPG